MKRASILLVALALSGCAHDIRYVRIPCLSPDQLEQRKQAEPPLVGKQLTGKAQEDIRIIGGSAKELRSWGKGNLDILSGCTG